MPSKHLVKNDNIWTKLHGRERIKYRSPNVSLENQNQTRNKIIWCHNSMALFGGNFSDDILYFCFVSSEATVSVKEARSEPYTVLVVVLCGLLVILKTKEVIPLRLVGCWSSVSMRRIIYKFLNVYPFDYTAVAVSVMVELSLTGLTTTVGWLSSLQLTVLSRSAIVV